MKGRTAMKTTLITVALLSFAAMASAQSTPCHTTLLLSDTLVDDFKTGQLKLGTTLANTYVPSNADWATTAGDAQHIVGGVRAMLLRVTGNPFLQPGEADIVNSPVNNPSGGALALTSGAQEFTQL